MTLLNVRPFLSSWPGVQESVKLETDSHGVERIALQRDGWQTWKWKGHKVNYAQAGTGKPARAPEPSEPPCRMRLARQLPWTWGNVLYVARPRLSDYTLSLQATTAHQWC